jgi:hypothetical protein
MTIENGRTTTPAYAEAIGDSGYESIALLTVGDEVPLLEGEFGNYEVSPDETFAMSGIPDGLGIYEGDDSYYVFMNHEISASDSDDEPIFTNINSTDADKIKGARVSVFEFNQDWEVIGGRNLIETIVDNATGDSYNINYETGLYENVDNSGDILNGDVGALSRFCSGFLADEGFIDPETGEETPMWFGPEEDGAPSNRGWAITANGIAYSLDNLGRFSKENVVSPVNYRPLSEGNTSNQTVLLSTEDFSDGELYMWVGRQTAADPNGFSQGELYVLQVVDPETDEYYSFETMPEDVALTAKWNQVPEQIALGSRQDTPEEITANLSEWSNANDNSGNPRSSNFRRLEDIGEDPTNPGTFYFATTGSPEVPEGQNEPDNPYGALHRISLNPDDVTADGEFTFTHTGGPDNGVSFDNLTVLNNGKVMVQEDAAYPPELLEGDIFTDEERQARIWEYDPDTDGVAPIFELKEDEFGGPDNDPDVRGEWESSGIIPTGMGNDVLFDVQAHTSRDDLFSEDGQLLLAQEEEIPDGNPVERRPVKGDFNSDGISDLLWRNFANGENGYWFMNDAQDGGSFAPTEKVAIVTQENPNWAISGTADFNGNGTEDILWRNFETGRNGIWLMNGTQRNAIRNLEAQSNPSWYIAGTGDANGDGIPDLYWRNSSTGSNGLWYLNQDFETVAKVSLQTQDSLDWEMVAVDDMNEDNVPDLIWRNQTSGQNGVWLMGGDVGQEVTEVLTLDEELNPNWEIRGTGDYNRDGNADLVWRNLANGNNGVWLYDGQLSRRAVVSVETETNTSWQITNR